MIDLGEELLPMPGYPDEHPLALLQTGNGQAEYGGVIRAIRDPHHIISHPGDGTAEVDFRLSY